MSGQVTKIVTTNLNKIINVNYYPVETARRSNLRHRPIGIGVQGLADTFILLGMAFDSPEVSQVQYSFVLVMVIPSVLISRFCCALSGSAVKQRHL